MSFSMMAFFHIIENEKLSAGIVEDNLITCIEAIYLIYIYVNVEIAISPFFFLGGKKSHFASVYGFILYMI